FHYGNFARAIGERLGYVPPKTASGTPCWWFTLSTGRATADDAKNTHGEWTMRPELVAALRAMKGASNACADANGVGAACCPARLGCPPVSRSFAFACLLCIEHDLLRSKHFRSAAGDSA